VAWPEAFERKAMAIDPAGGKKTGDFAAIVFAGLSGGLLWIDAVLKKQPAEQVVADAIRLMDDWKPDLVGYEANHLQGLIAREFDRQCAENGIPPLPLIAIHNRFNKRIRIQDLGTYLERRKFRFRDTEGCRLVVQQLREFPLARYDDGPDALQMAIQLLVKHRFARTPDF